MPEPIEITFLGTGSSTPTPQRGHPAILIKYSGDHMLFDCGEGTQIQLQKARVSPMKIKRIFISHWHADHFAGLLPMIETLHLQNRKEPLEIYGPEASRFVDAISELSYWGIGFEIKTKDCGEEDMEKILDTENYEIHSIKVDHSVPSVGYIFKEKDRWNIDTKLAKKYKLSGKDLKIIKEKGIFKGIKLSKVAKLSPGRKLIYSGDTRVSKKLFNAAKNADLLIHDGTFTEPMESRAHSSVKEVAKLSKKYNVKKLVLTHFSRRYKSVKEIEKIAKKIFKNSIVARDMMEMKL